MPRAPVMMPVISTVRSHCPLLKAICSIARANDVFCSRKDRSTSVKQTKTPIVQMGLTVDQALQQGISAHKEGKLQDAERLYRAILQAQPEHPDANHNLGVLAVSVGKPLDALPLFKLALEANPQIEQFWLSYLDALIKVECLDDACRVLAEGEKFGVFANSLNAIKQRLREGEFNDMPKTPKGQLPSRALKKPAEKKIKKVSKK